MLKPVFRMLVVRNTVGAARLWRNLARLSLAQAWKNPFGNSAPSALDSIVEARIISGMLAIVSRRARTIQTLVWLFAFGQ